MTYLGCTGHQSLTRGTRRRIAAAISKEVASSTDDLVGLTSLAEGADQMFAYTILAAGGELHVIVPSEDYDRSFQSDSARIQYNALLELATRVTSLPFEAPSEEAFLAAGHAVADASDVLLAVWDGQEAEGKGGTGDIVAYGRDRGLDVRVIWPPGSERG